MRTAAAIACGVVALAGVVRAEIIDRIAVTVDNQPIMQSQIVTELKIAAFLNGEKPDLGATARRGAANRLIERLLLRREMEYTHYPGTGPGDFSAAFDQLRTRYGGENGLKDALAAAGLTEKDITAALTSQSALLRFIDMRFRPEVQVQEPEILQYYSTVLVPEFRRRNQEPPSFDDARDDCEEALMSERVDKRVDAWLAEGKARARINYVEDAFA